MRTLLLIMTALGAATTFGAIRAVTPTAWNGNPNCWQMKRHNEKMAAVTNGGSRVVFIGDSITHFWEGAGAEQWKKYFAGAPYRALDLGTSGDRTEHVLWRLTEGRELDGYEAKCILLMIGTNNSGHFPFEKEPPIDTIAGIRHILDVIAEKQPKARTILTAIFPRGAGPTDACRMRNDVVNKEISRFADGRKVIWCDFSDKYLDAEGRLSPELFPDLLHPNARGYEIWASSVIPLIDRVLAAGPDDVIPSVWPSNPSTYSLQTDRLTRPTSAYGLIKWWDRGVTLDHRNAIVDSPTNEFDVVWVGDSITHRWVREGGEGRELWAKISKDYRMLNLGIGGDGTQHVLWRLTNGELEGYRAKLFTLMIGTNNCGEEPKRVAAGVKSIVELIRRKHPESKIVLMSIFPRNARPDDRLRVSNGKVNEIIRGYADGKTVLWLDFGAKFLEGDGTLTKRVMDDLLHPNATGYRIWWDAIRPVIREVCGVPLMPGQTCEQAMEKAWNRVMTGLWDPGTGCIYDYIASNRFGEVSYKACMATPEEMALQFPNPNGWRIGLEDCDLKGGPMLVAAIRRLDAHGGKDPVARETIDKVYKGLRNCATVSGIPGFVARGISPLDGKSFYINSSRDQYTLFIYSMWRYYRSGYADDARKAEIRRMLTDIAKMLNRIMTDPKAEMSLLRADGKPGDVGYMWVKNPRRVVPVPEDAHFVYFDNLMNSHEAFRLSMFYAAAWDVTGDAQWRTEQLKYMDDAFFMTGPRFVPYGFDLPSFALYQAQVSHRLLWEVEPDAATKAKLEDVMRRFAKMADRGFDTVEKALEKITDDVLYGPVADWRGRPFHYRSGRNGGQPPGELISGLPYMIPEVPDYWAPQQIPEHLGLALLSRLMVPGESALPASEIARFRRLAASVDWSRHCMSSMSQMLLAYWGLEVMKEK